MISQEFKSTVLNKNVLRTRIMLKDSIVLDPTFNQFDEMLKYAEQNIPDILVHYDGGTLEEDNDKWDQDVMNSELAQLVNNFSEVRIDHLKKVTNKVMAAFLRPEERKKALQQILIEGQDISAVIGRVKNAKKWDQDSIKKLDYHARRLLDAITRYYENTNENGG